MKTEYDFIVVGGNMVGAAIALNLAMHSHKVALIERNTVDCSESSHDGKPFDLRVSAIIPPVIKYFKYLDVWSNICKKRYQPFDRMTVWENNLDYAFHFNASEIAQENLGAIIENSIIQSALWQRLRQYENVHLFQGTWEGIEEFDESIAVTLSDGRIVDGGMLIAADGAQSKIREWANIECANKKYNQVCLVGTVYCEKAHQNTCWQRYQNSLPFAFLPLPNNHCSIAWYINPDEKEHLLQDEHLEDRLFEVSNGVLGKIIKVGEFGAFPLHRQHAKNWYKEKVVLVGDAAHSVHPMAGQGANLGLIDAAVLAEEVLKAGSYYTKEAVKKSYQRRRSEVMIIEYGMDAINILFQKTPHFMQGKREKMLSLANDITPLKRLLGRYGSGLSRDLPVSMIDG